MHRIDLDDVTWAPPIVSVFSGLEPSMSATLRCVPLLKPLLGLGKRRIFQGSSLRGEHFERIGMIRSNFRATSHVPR